MSMEKHLLGDVNTLNESQLSEEITLMHTDDTFDESQVLKQEHFESQMNELEPKEEKFEGQMKELEFQKKHLEIQMKELESIDNQLAE
ncbi:COP1-interactive protein [Trifolium repens]|nr:COP1-interactive protein [Trifolium repens]